MASLDFLSCSAIVGMMVQLLYMLHSCASSGGLPVASHPQDPVASPCFSAQSCAFLHTLLHTTLTWFPPKYKVSKCWITSKLARNKTKKWLIKFNLTKVLNTWKAKGFKRLSVWFSIDRKLDLIDWMYRSSSDRTRQSQTKILIVISIGRETSSIDRKCRKINFLKNKAILCKNSLKHSILWIECMSMRWNAFQKHLYWTQISQK